MPRSTTVWAAVLLLASFSGSGPLLTTAEAIPAPIPQQTQGRPMYYFPRHVKRQIVTNHTESAAPTTTPAQKSSSAEERPSRQGPDLTSLVNSLFHSDPQTPSSSAPVSSKQVADPTSLVPSTQGAASTSLPISSEGSTGNSRSQDPPAPVSSSPSSPVNNLPLLRSSSGNPEVILTSSQESLLGGSPSLQPTSSLRTLVSRSDINNPAQGSTDGLPQTIVPPTSSAPVSPPVQSSSAGGLLSILAPLVGSTGVLPLPVSQPTSSAQNLVSRSDINNQGTTGGLPNTIVSATSAAPSPVASQPSSDGGILSSTAPSPVVSQPSSDGGILSSVLAPLVGSTGILPLPAVQPTSSAVSADPPVSSAPTGSLLGPFIIGASTPAPSPTASPTLQSSQASGILVGLTTAFTPTAPLATQATASASASSDLLGLPQLLSSVLSEVPAVLSTPTPIGTAPIVTSAPTAAPSGILPPLVSSLVSDLPSLLSSVISEVPPSALPSILSQVVSALPTGTAPLSSLPAVLPTGTDLLSSLLVLPTGTAPLSSLPVVQPTGSLPLSSVQALPTSEVVLPSGTVSATPPLGSITAIPTSVAGVLPSSGVIGTSAAADTTLSASPSRIPASELPASNISLAQQSSVSVVTAVPASSANSATLAIPATPVPSSKASPVFSLAATATDSRTVMEMPSSIIQAPIPTVSATSTPSAVPSSLPKLIVPPDGIPTAASPGTFMGQICFNYKLNYQFVAANDGGAQIFHYLPMAIANALNISVDQVQNMGLKPYDTLKYQGFVTTIALFTIPQDLESTLESQLHNPMDALWHNSDSTVNDLTSLINTACPLSAGKTPADSSTPNQVVQPVNPSTVGNGDGSALGGDIGASRKVNSTSAIVASSAIVGAFAYGAAMFFVARRYRRKRNLHQRTSSVPSMSRMTYGSIPGGAAAWMHGARNGRLTPGSRGSHGSDSTQGHSIRTQQISAPVMAENSLGWN